MKAGKWKAIQTKTTTASVNNGGIEKTNKNLCTHVYVQHLKNTTLNFCINTLLVFI